MVLTTYFLYTADLQWAVLLMRTNNEEGGPRKTRKKNIFHGLRNVLEEQY